ncbi:hypothetical protein TrCOL_g2371 [Triparma columacea]|uniref:Mitochondrial import inner membrane translocase subunit TIM50 n=1 Tax=Triparma columacea TaxID=722753 RepID=A0A9W7LB33_9STRA|nr:hypothetical protein TrCOL_g2371 [Triparma columacea]
MFSPTPAKAKPPPPIAISPTSVEVVATPQTPSTTDIRKEDDIRSPGAAKTPKLVTNKRPSLKGAAHIQSKRNLGLNRSNSGTPDFITQTDSSGKASTPRPNDLHPVPNRRNDAGGSPSRGIFAFWRLLTCCVRDGGDDMNNFSKDAKKKYLNTAQSSTVMVNGFGATAAPGFTLNSSSPMPPPSSLMLSSVHGTLPGTVDPFCRDVCGGTFPSNGVNLLPLLSESPRPTMESGKEKLCLVLDLDETLVHSSFRAVEGADFVIPVRIEDVVHYVYVMKRPWVDSFLAALAPYYELVVYTASLNKYADPLLDLLDPKGLIEHRLFRESCVQWGGNYVKDLSILNRDLR